MKFDLEEAFDNADFSENGNAEMISSPCYPYLGYERVELVHRIDLAIHIMQYESQPIINRREYRYELVNKGVIDAVRAIEYDPYNDAAYAESMLEIGRGVFDE